MMIDETTYDFLKTSDTQRRAILDNILSHITREPDKKLVDLGAGHCMFSRVAALHGYKVMAVDARADRKPPALPPNISFRQQDIRAFDLAGFDVVLILGLLYHLTLEDQINLLARCPTGARVIIDTQVHIRELVAQDLWDEMKLDADALAQDSGYEGIVFPEHSNLQASVGNAQSWWHTEPSLLKLFKDAGFLKCVMIGPPYVSKYGGRRWYVLSKQGK